MGDGIDYYFVYGPADLDHVVAGYRRSPAQAPMMPHWAFGFWQCRERYKTQQESLDVLDGLPLAQHPGRRHRAGLAVLERSTQWGSHEFDATRFPDPDAWITSDSRRSTRS